MILTRSLTSFSITILILVSASTAKSQSLQLTRGNITKSIDVGSYLEVKQTRDNNNSDCDYCLYKGLTGTLLDVSNTSLIIEVEKLVEIKEEDDFNLKTEVRYSQNLKEVEIPFSEIFFIKKNNNKKGSKRKEAIAVTASISIFVGLINTLQALIIGKDRETNTLLTVGLIEVGLGAIVFPFSYQRSFNLRNDEDAPWRIISN